jgi:glycosyltransferase involved in cell wall biosynthesis
MKSDILCIGLPQWDGNYQKPIVEILKEMSAFHRILYVEYTPTWKDTKGWKPGRLRKVVVENGQEIWVFTPPSLFPINWLPVGRLYDRFLQWNAEIVKKSVQQVIKQLHIQNPICINAFQPALGVKLNGAFGERALYYFCYDEISEAEWCKKHLARYEPRFLGEVDGVLVTSSGLYETKKKQQPNIALVQNGVESSLFKDSISPNPQNKVIGYLGTIDDRMDVEILEKAIVQFPDYQFLFVGRVTDASVQRTLEKYANVLFTGAKSPEELTSYLAKIQIGLIPFIKNGFTKNIYPMKINQYLAYGMPVVSTDFADLSDFGDLIYHTTSEGFLDALSKAMQENTTNFWQERRDFAEGNTWKNKAIQFSNFIEL